MECPFCQHEIAIEKGKCPVCRRRLYEVTEADFEERASAQAADEHDIPTTEDTSLEEAIESRFVCAKCGGDECRVKEVAVTGAGLSKLLDIQHNHYLFVSCLNCGNVEIYDPTVLRGRKAGALGTILDLLF